MEQPIHLETLYPPSGIPTNLSDGQVQRPVFLDGANMMCGMAKTERNGRKIASASSIIALLRYLTAHGFQAYILVQPKYTLLPMHGKIMLKILQDKGLLFSQPAAVYDDVALFEMARVSGGAVVSNDWFADHKDLQHIIREKAVRIQFKPIPENKHHRMTADGHYIAFHTFEFVFSDRFIARLSDNDYSLVLDRRRSFTETRRAELMTLFDKMLYKSTRVFSDGPNTEISSYIRQKVEKKCVRFNIREQKRQAGGS